MRTSGTGVFAVGDVAQAYNESAGRHLSVEHWDALEHGRIAGTVLAGGEASWTMAPGFWSTIGDKTLKYWAWGTGGTRSASWTRARSSPSGTAGGYFGRCLPTARTRTTKKAATSSNRGPLRLVTLPLPNPALRVCVVVPARNEEELIGSCLRSLAEQVGVSYEEYEVLLVLDDCTSTEMRARDVAASYPALRLHFLNGPGEGSGHARRRYGCRLRPAARRGSAARPDADTMWRPTGSPPSSPPRNVGRG